MQFAVQLAKWIVPSPLMLMALPGSYLFAQATPGNPQDCWHGHGPGMMWGGEYGGGFAMGFGFLVMLIFLAGTIAFILLAIRYFAMSSTQNETNAPKSNSKDALAILNERFAKGEIDAQEFAERKRILSE
jgi:putative membrane protein